jgi:hypothetical protein
MRPTPVLTNNQKIARVWFHAPLAVDWSRRSSPFGVRHGAASFFVRYDWSSEGVVHGACFSGDEGVTMAERRHWAAKAGVGAAAAALLVTGLRVTALGDEGPPGGAHRTAAASAAPAAPRATTAPATPTPTGSAAQGPPGGGMWGALPGAQLPPLGAFTDSGEEGVRSLAALQTWLGGTQIRVGHTYLPGDSWDAIEGDGDLLRPWAEWKRAAPDRLFVLNVPMQERNEDHLPDGVVRSLIRQGASGAFDAHFSRLAQRLVRLGVPDTVIVLGWEMNGTTYTHRCGPDPQDWKTYWNRVVAAMRAVPGQHFRFDFAPNRGQDAIGWTACYPGDASVDIVGMDSYDQPSGESFYDQVTEPFGLQAQVEFAAAHHKAISYPEWGMFRNGDDPDYMSLMLAWIARHRPLYQTITDYCPHGVWQCQENPKATAVYRSLLYARQVAPVWPKPKPGGPPTPPTTAPTPGGTPSPTPPATSTPPATPTPTAGGGAGGTQAPTAPAVGATPTATGTPGAPTTPTTPAATRARPAP